MTGNQTLLTVHELQTRYWGISEARETPSDQLKRQAGALLSDENHPALATIVTCPDCEGLRYHEVQCECYPLNPKGCSFCDGRGWIPFTCTTCRGEGEVLMYQDGHVEVLV